MRMLGELRPRSHWQRNLYAILIAVFIAYLAYTTVMPFLPQYIQELGVDDPAAVAVWTGLLFGISPLLGAILSPIWGALADRYGRKAMIQRPLFGFTVTMVLMAFATNVYHLLALRIAVGLFAGFGAMTMAFAASTVPRERTSWAIGLVQATQIVGQAIGPAIGGLLADGVGIRPSFLITAALFLATFVMIVFLLQEPPAVPVAAGVAAPPLSSPGFRALLTLPNFGALALVLLLVQFVDRSFGPIVPLYVAALGTDPGSIATMSGLIISVGAGAGAVSAALVGRVAERRSLLMLLLATLVGGTLCVVPIAFVSTAWQLFALRLVLGLIAGGSLTLAYSAAGLVLPAHARGAGFGALSTATMLGSALSPFASGFIAAYSLRAIFLLDAVLYAGAVGWVWLRLRTPPAVKTAPMETAG